MITKKYTLWTVLSVTAFPAFSQNGQTSASRDQETVVVTASRFLQPVSSVLAPMDIVTREEIDRWQVKSLAEVMRRLPGVDIAQYGGIGQQSSLFIRGTETRHALVLVDGVRFNQVGVTGAPNLSQIPISMVQRIEYIRGPRSAVYGSDAIGGVVNIITVREAPGTALSAGLGSNGYQSYDGATQQQVGEDTTLTAAGNYTYTQGYDVVANYPDDFGNSAQPDRDGFMSQSLWLGVNHAFSGQLSGFARAYGFDNRVAYDNAYDFGTPYRLDTNQLYSRTYNTGLNFQQDAFATMLNFNYNQTKDYNYDPAYGPYHASATLDDISQHNVQWGNVYRLNSGTLSGGIDWQYLSTEPGTNYLAYGYTQRNTGIYTTVQQQVGDVILEGGLRGDNNSQFGWHTTWQSSGGWEFATGYRLILSYGTAYKAPNLGQLYSQWGGNPQLKPEESRQWEAGLEGDNSLLSWRLSAYHNDITNMIQSESQAPWTNHNIGKATIKGVEWTGAFVTGPLSHQVTLEYLDPRNAETDERLLRRARQQAKYQLDGQLAVLDWSLSYLYLGARDDRDFNRGMGERITLGGVSVWELAAAYPVTSQLMVRGRIANLFDKDYETVYGYHTPGREFYLTGSYTF